MGLLRLIATAALVWFVFRWLDRMFGASAHRRSRPQDRSGRSRTTSAGRSGKGATPKDDGLGDYVDFEEIDDK